MQLFDLSWQGAGNTGAGAGTLTVTVFVTNVVGATKAVVKEFSTLELVTCGLPITLAKRVFKAARDLPDTDARDFGDDGVAVDRRLAGGAVDGATVLAELRAIDDDLLPRANGLERGQAE